MFSVSESPVNDNPSIMKILFMDFTDGIGEKKGNIMELNLIYIESTILYLGRITYENK
jgi:hypothetical protein